MIVLRRIDFEKNRCTHHSVIGPDLPKKSCLGLVSSLSSSMHQYDPS